jgi:hypothetical protein
VVGARPIGRDQASEFWKSHSLMPTNTTYLFWSGEPAGFLALKIVFLIISASLIKINDGSLKVQRSATHITLPQVMIAAEGYHRDRGDCG